MSPPPPPRTFRIGEQTIRRGETRSVHLKISERYTGDPITLPLRVVRAAQPGPTLFVSAAVHGDEINGTGIIHDLMFAESFKLLRGTLMLIPVVNIFGFESHERYLPDRRDLNRSFPGSPNGSLTSRVAHTVFHQIVDACDFGIDLHTAALHRVNYPNVRGDLSIPGVRKLAHAFGSELIVNSKGPVGSLRREATRAGCPTVILEAGEPNKIEPSVLQVGVRGVENVLKAFGMIAGEPVKPAYQTRVTRSTWVRAQLGGILRFHVAPGDPVDQGQPIATNTSLFGREQNTLTSPVDGIVLGMTTLPAVKPGEPVCHIAVPSRSLAHIRRALDQAPRRSLHRRVRRDLATNISVSEHEGDTAPTALPEFEA